MEERRRKRGREKIGEGKKNQLENNWKSEKNVGEGKEGRKKIIIGINWNK